MNIKLLVYLLVSTTLAIAQQYTTIPDSKFETILIGIGIDTGSVDGKVATDRISSVISLDINNLEITDLTGLQDFTSLKQLSCYSNKLTSIDLSKNLALTGITCRDNPITSLDVSNNTLLEYISCSNNKLTSLDVSKNLALNYLYCGDNTLSSLDLTNNIALKEIRCDYNTLKALDVTHCPLLEYFICSNNKLTSLDMTKSTALIELRCDHNSITSLDLSNSKDLLSINCIFNKLTSLDVRNSPTMSELYAQYNSDLKTICVSSSLVLDSFFTKDDSAVWSTNCTAVGIETVVYDSNVSIYPNPSNGVFSIEVTKPVKALISDMTGKKVKTLLLQSGINNWESSLEQGIYYLQIQDKTIKIVVQ